MARHARIIVPRLPHHIVLCGHIRQAVFVAARDYEYCLSNLRELKATLGLQVV